MAGKTFSKNLVTLGASSPSTSLSSRRSSGREFTEASIYPVSLMDPLIKDLKDAERKYMLYCECNLLVTSCHYDQFRIETDGSLKLLCSCE